MLKKIFVIKKRVKFMNEIVIDENGAAILSQVFLQIKNAIILLLQTFSAH